MEWKQIEGFNCSVSNEGQVRNDKSGRLLKLSDTTGCYRLPWEREYKLISISSLLSKYWKFEWIKWLEDDEEAREVKGFSKYYVTNKGRIFSLYKYRFLTPVPVCEYYYMVGLTDDQGSNKNRLVHTLVGRHFLEGYQEGDYILHNEEKLPFPDINFKSNLRLGDHQANAEDIHLKSRDKTSKVTPSIVRAIREMSKQGLMGIEIAQHFGVSPNTVYGILTGKNFSYIE